MVMPNTVSLGKAGVIEVVSLDWGALIASLSLIAFSVLASSTIIGTEGRRVTGFESQGSSETYQFA
jgi:hypothetical protein